MFQYALTLARKKSRSEIGSWALDVAQGPVEGVLQGPVEGVLQGSSKGVLQGSSKGALQGRFA
jgi:hypothetical protein